MGVKRKMKACTLSPMPPPPGGILSTCFSVYQGYLETLFRSPPSLKFPASWGLSQIWSCFRTLHTSYLSLETHLQVCYQRELLFAKTVRKTEQSCSDTGLGEWKNQIPDVMTFRVLRNRQNSGFAQTCYCRLLDRLVCGSGAKGLGHRTSDWTRCHHIQIFQDHSLLAFRSATREWFFFISADRFRVFVNSLEQARLVYFSRHGFRQGGIILDMTHDKLSFSIQQVKLKTEGTRLCNNIMAVSM